jgi:hypothetical protein
MVKMSRQRFYRGESGRRIESDQIDSVIAPSEFTGDERPLPRACRSPKGVAIYTPQLVKDVRDALRVSAARHEVSGLVRPNRGSVAAD